MARVTVEDCVLKIPNRFELVMLASQRARAISSGAVETVERDNDKNPVIALREIADQTIEFDEIREALVSGLQKHRLEEDHEDEADEAEILAIQSAMAAETGMTIGGDTPTPAGAQPVSKDAELKDEAAVKEDGEEAEAADGAAETKPADGDGEAS